MATIKNFEELDCWQEARRLVRHIYSLTEREGFKSDFELKNQIKRSSISIMANIAEGFHRKTHKDFMKFLDYSRSSCAETVSHLYIAFDQKYLSENELSEIKSMVEMIWKKLNGLIGYLNTLNRKGQQRFSEDSAAYGLFKYPETS